MNEYPLTELMHAIDRECKSSEPKVKSARIYTKGDDTSVNSSRTAFFSPKSYPLTALTAFPEQGVITIEERLEKTGRKSKDIVSAISLYRILTASRSSKKTDHRKSRS